MLYNPVVAFLRFATMLRGKSLSTRVNSQCAEKASKCVGLVSDLCQTCVRLVSDLCRTCVELVSDVSECVHKDETALPMT